MPELISLALTPDERQLLVVGLREWGGPARSTDALAKVMGFSDVRSLFEDGERIAALISAEEALSPEDWARAQIATELAFMSDYYGSGLDWSIVAGHDDETTVRRLRELQRKLSGAAQLPD